MNMDLTLQTQPFGLRTVTHHMAAAVLGSAGFLALLQQRELKGRFPGEEGSDLCSARPGCSQALSQTPVEGGRKTTGLASTG